MFFIVAIVFLVLYLMEHKKLKKALDEALASQNRCKEAQEMLSDERDEFQKKLNEARKAFQDELSASQNRVKQALDLSNETVNSLKQAENKLKELHYDEYAQVKAEMDRMNREIADGNSTVSALRARIADLTAQEAKLAKQTQTAANKLAKSRELYKSVEYSINAYINADVALERCKLSPSDSETLDAFAPSVLLRLHSMDIKALNKAFRENDKQIESLLTQYAGRYTTKANQAIYKLMVIALRSELQNILYNLKSEKLDVAEEQVKAVASKYLSIATDGNQNIAGTVTKFIGEVEYLFINAVKIEYNYYVKKEQAKQEQAAIREQMRQEAAERKALEAEKKKIEAEESKYQGEIERVQKQISDAAGEEADMLMKRVRELEAMLSDVRVKKDDVLRLQNGRAGTVYVISNLGSFGENIFKIGMTRRLTPQDRIDELGSASVPFNFDVHSFIFSQDAVALEGQLHQRLNNQRVNKVNLRKEFFYSSVEELEAIVNEIDPSAEFTRTMVAEDFRQSQSTNEVYASIDIGEDGEDDDEEE